MLPQFTAPTLPKVTSAASRSAITAPVSIAIDARGADREGLLRVEAQVARLRAELPTQVVATVRDAQKRRAL
ncbi:MAG: hypothetical protein WBA66_04920 [Xanthobacteraceae bacterium]